MPNPVTINGEYVRVLGPVTASVQSKRDGEIWYAIDLDARDGHGECNCPGFQYRKSCRHLKVVRAWAAARPDVELPVAPAS